MTSRTVDGRLNLPLTRAVFSERGWAAHLLYLGLAWTAIFAVFARDVMDMAGIWWNASTFNHCLLIGPIIIWLVAQRRDEVAQVKPQAWLPGAAFLCAASCIWMLGEAAGVAQVRHIGLILMLQASVLTLLGPNVTRALLFPLFYMCFLVPAGEELVPLLQTITAKMCMGLLWLFGVPAHINGIFITIPNGYFEVAEACSGVKFLIAMVAYGALVSNICFKSWARRAAFMAVAIVVPVIANGLRAFATIYYAHLTTVESAAGFDHVFYGWFFFAIVMALVMGLGWRLFDRSVDDKWLSDAPGFAWARGSTPARGLMFGAVAVMAPVLWLGTASALGKTPMPSAISLPNVVNWARVKASEPAWDAHFAGADHRLLGHFKGRDGVVVDLSVAVFAWQDEGREMNGFGQGAVAPNGRWTWAADVAAPKGGKAERIVTLGPINREVVSFYVTKSGKTGSMGAVKFETLKNRMMGGDQAVAAVLVSAIDTPQYPARKAIDAFIADMGDPEKVAKQMINQARGR
jgi:exosortase A